MGKSIVKKFYDFKVRNGLSNETIVQIVTEYANSSLELARTHYSEKFDISERTFYKCRDYAVICCLVDNQTCKRLRAKAATNCSSHNPKKSSVAPIAHFEELIANREIFISEFSAYEILDIAHKYTEGVTLKNIAIAYETGELGIQKLLKKGIVDLIYDASLTKQISNMIGPSLNGILQERELSKKFLLNCIRKEIDFLEAQIACYNIYFRNSNSKSKPSLETLEKNLANASKMYEETLKL